MSKTTSIQTGPQTGAAATLDTSAAPSVRRQNFLPDWVHRLLKPVASLRVTVVLFVLSLALVFFGTMAQIDAGTGTVIERYFRSFHIVWVPFQIFVQFGQVFLHEWVPPDAHLSGSFPFPGGYLLGSFLLANLLAAHLVRFRISWKRSGILLIHGGLILLMLGEWIAGTFAVEGRMTIDEGKSSNYVEHFDKVELAFIDPSDPRADDVVAIPGSFLKKGGLIQHPDLPCDVEVNRYYVNSHLGQPGGDNPATKEAGLQKVAIEDNEVSGTTGGGRVNVPSAYVTFKDKKSGQSLGTYLTSLNVASLQPVQVGDKTYGVALRFQRTYKPYSLYLYEFRFDRYPGTNEPRNYSSRVRLQDAERGDDREVLIKMNEPLRHRGETIYQVDFDKETEKTTILQVVENPGWLLPYVSCTLISLGMVIHFGIYLNEFVRRRLAS
jgi:hypothetical protein